MTERVVGAGQDATRVQVDEGPAMVVEAIEVSGKVVGVSLDGTRIEADTVDLGGSRRGLRVAGQSATVLISPRRTGPSPDRPGPEERWEVVVDGWRFEVSTQPELHARLRERATRAGARGSGDARVELRAIIPGRIVSIAVAGGDSVEAGQAVLILEAMKMQNELRAPRAGRIARVAVTPGQTIERGDVLVVIE